jgi:hypothetical protein
MVAAKTWLWIIVLLTIGTRLLLAFTIPNFTYDSYFYLRQVDHVTNTGLPLYHDPLSYGGRDIIYLPLFYYFMSFFDLFMPLELAAKIVPNIVFASLTIIVFYISKTITKNEPASLFSALIAGFLPIIFTPNSFTVTSLFLPLVFLNIYAFLNLREKFHLSLYLLTFLLLCLTSSAVFLLVFGQGLYLFLAYLEHKKIDSSEREIIIFSLFFFIWSQFLFFKNSFILEGISFIWGNVPPQIILQYFPKVSLIEAILLVSLIPFVIGVYIVYRSLFQLKNIKTFFLISLVVSTTLLAWMQLIEFTLSLAFFGIILAILFSLFYHESSQYVEQTKIAHYSGWYTLGLVLLLGISTIYPALNHALNQDIPTQDELDAFAWLRDNTRPGAGVLALLEQGHLVTYISQRRNLMDERFSLVEKPEQQMEDLGRLYQTSFQTEALALLDEYNLNYLVLSPRALEQYDLKKFKYTSQTCFRKLYDEKGVRIYQVTCSLKKVLA